MGDHVFLRVSPKKGLIRFRRGGKLAPRYIGPFEILARIGAVTYRLALPPQMGGVHDVFHVSMLRQYHPDPSHVIDWTDIEIAQDASYEAIPVQVIDSREQILRGKTIPLVRVQWQHHGAAESTWEREDVIREKYPHLFAT